jgi:Glycosyl hydrolase catalytic core
MTTGLRAFVRSTSLGATLAGALASLGGCSSNDLEPIRAVPQTSASDASAGGMVDATSPGTGSDGGAMTVVPTDGGGTRSAKRGVAYGYNTDADMAALSAGATWWYNWAATPDGTLKNGYAQDGVEFVPMIWGGTFDTSALATQIPADAKYLLTFNEPNFGAPQSNLTPAQAAALWPQIQTFAQSRGMKIVSPGVNYCGSPCNDTDPFDWLSKFFAACTNCEVDYVAMHWYACTKSALTSTVQKYEQQFGKPLWVTEFSCLDDSTMVTDPDELSYMAASVAALEADPMVFRYSWFTGRSTSSPPVSLLADSGVLTPLGAQYVSLPH